MSRRYEITCDECGHVTVADTQRRAEYGQRVHSCERQKWKAERTRRRRERAAAVDRTPKPCGHKNTTHVHGTYACYVLDMCRCEPCSNANAVYERNRLRQKAYGRWNGLVDATPAREHVKRLQAAGMGLKRITEKSGVSGGTLSKLMYGIKDAEGNIKRKPSSRIKPETANKILTVDVDLAAGARLDNTGTTRRLQALVALGWSQAEIARRIGINQGNLVDLIHGRRQVTRGTYDRARALYDELSMRLPPTDTREQRTSATRARNTAARYGWLPPLAWDDELLDDPTHKPVLERKAVTHDELVDEAAIYRRMHGDRSVRLSKADAAELVRRWVASGRPVNECERITGLKPDRYRLRHNDKEAS